MSNGEARPLIPVPHFVRGRSIEEYTIEYPSAGLITPSVNLDELVWPRPEPFPAIDLSLDDVLEFLAVTGRALDLDTNPYLQDALDSLCEVNPYGRRTIEGHYRELKLLFEREAVAFEYEESLGKYGEGWHDVRRPDGNVFQRRWFPTRQVHVLPGNGAQAAALTIVRAALVRGVALLKLPSNDPFTVVAILRTMTDIEPEHPLVDSFSAVYWRGGDDSVESVLFRPQFFDKLIAWGGQGSIRNAIKYLSPGFELVSFDPKTAISMIGVEAFADPELTAHVANLASEDVQYQMACGSSRHQFVEGTVEQADAYCEALLRSLHAYHEREQGECVPTPAEIIDEVDVMRTLEPTYRVWGNYDGTGLVVRSDEPVDFYPENRTVNVVRVDSLHEALQYVNVATAKVGIFPPQAKGVWRDALATGGADRITDLGGGGKTTEFLLGRPHDGMLPLHRFPRWIYAQT